LGSDPMRPVLELKPDLHQALENLAQRLNEPGRPAKRESPPRRKSRRP